MNILTFDIEEWYLEKIQYGGRKEKNQLFDKTFGQVLDDLDRFDLKATFFCVGKLAEDFPEVIRSIASRGHEVGCHSNEHTWLTAMDEKVLRDDTLNALKALEDVSGQRVISYRAPAFSITESNPWAIAVLTECGIENDASIFPAKRDHGGYASFPQDKPCIIGYQGATLKEFPICLTSVSGKTIAYSGGGYFRLFPYWLIDRTMKKRDYNICYFHLSDLIHEEVKLMTKKAYEEYFKEPGTLKNRFMRYLKSNIGTGDAYGKMTKLLSTHSFVNIQEADALIDWNKTAVISL